MNSTGTRLSRAAEAEAKEAAAQEQYLRQHVTPEDAALAKQRVELAQARLDLAKCELAKCSLRAPVAGLVLDVLHREGEAVDEITLPPVIVLADVGRLRVTAEIDEEYVSLLRTGMRACVSGRNLQGHVYEGRIGRVKPRIGGKAAFNGDPSERRSRNVAEVYVELEEGFSAPLNLMVDVMVLLGQGF